MSKMNEMAVAYGNNQVGFFSDLTNAYTQGWKDCLKHDESVKELISSLEFYCGNRCDKYYNPCQAEISLSKFREKVGE